MRLPKIPYVMNKNKSQVVPLGNINFCAATSDGDLVDSCGISARKFPYMTTRGAERGYFQEWEDRVNDEADDESKEYFLNIKVTDFYQWNGKYIYIVDWNVEGEETLDLYIEDSPSYTFNARVATLTKSRKQFIPINTKLVIFPDKVYLDSTDDYNKLHSLEAKTSLSRVIVPLEKSNTLKRIPYDGENDEYDTKYGYFEGNTFHCMKKTDLFDNTVVRNESGTSFKAVQYIGKVTIVRASDEYGEKRYTIVPNSESTEKFNEFADDFLNKNKYLYYETDGILYSAKYLGKTTLDGKTVFEMDRADFASNQEINLYCDGLFPIYQDGDLPGGVGKLTEKQKYYFTFGSAYMTGAYVISKTAAEIRIEDPISYSSAWIATLTASEFTEKGHTGVSGVASFYLDCPTSTNDGFVGENSYSTSQIKLNGNFLPDDGEVHEVKIYSSGVYRVGNLTDVFKVGDTVVARSRNARFGGEKTFTITALTPGSMSTSADIFTPGDYPDMVIERRIPDLDFACECHNRLFGCSNADKTIYVSALGDPTNMMTYEGVSTDAFAVAVAGEGDFTACCAHDSSVLFWKENKLHKLTGYTPADFALYTYQVDGVQAGSEASAQIINEVLYYKGVNGVFAYTGGIPQLISQNFGERKFRGAVGGSDGDTYYISMSDNDGDYLFAYETRSNMWVLEDKIKCDSFVRSDGSLKYVSDGKVYELTGGETPREHEWFMQLAPMYETMEGKKTYSRILLRVELPIGSYIIASVRMDGGRWLETGKIVGKTDNVVPIRIPVNRCDKFELKLSGRGPCTILGIMREYYVGGDV